MARQELPRDHVVYRVFDETGVLLYIGCTSNIRNRFSQHRGTSSWFPYAHHRRISGPFNRADAYRIESEAIRAEIPFFNRTHGRDTRRDLEFLTRASEWTRNNPEAPFDEACVAFDEISAQVTEEFGHITLLDEYLELRETRTA